MTATMTARPRSTGIAAAAGVSKARGGTLQATVANMTVTFGNDGPCVSFCKVLITPVVGGVVADTLGTGLEPSNVAYTYESASLVENSDGTRNVQVSQVVAALGGAWSPADTFYCLAWDQGETTPVLQAVAGPFTVLA